MLSSAVKADVSASIDRSPVRVNETFELSLNMETAPVSRPQLTGLPDAFEIIRSTNFYQRSTINGISNVEAGWRFIIKAKEEGIFTIPEFEIDGKKTQLLQLKVLPPVSSTNIGTKQDAIRLTTDVDSNEVYVQQQILFTIRLYRAVQAQYASLTEPEMSGALLERLGEDRQFESEIDGVRYIVLERQYAIFPQQQGSQTISAVTFSAEVSTDDRQYSSIGRLRSRTSAVSLSSDAIEINVNAIPDAIGDWWLPAKEVTLTEQWQPDPTQFRVGEPVTWNYTITAKGLTATQLPELLPATTDGLKFYPDIAQSNNLTDLNGITGIRSQKVAVVPTRAGILSLPELKLSWWNSKQNKAQQILLPSRTIEVLASEDGDYGVSPTKPKAVEIKTEDLAKGDDQKDAIQAEQPIMDADYLENNIWKIIAIFSLLLWLLTALFFIVRKNRASTLAVKQHHQPPPTTTSSFADIEHACQQNSAEKTKQALLNWCANQQGLETVHSLAELARRVGSAELLKQLTIVERSLYGINDKTWQGEELAVALKDLKLFVNKDRKISTKEKLPALHLTEE